MNERESKVERMNERGLMRLNYGQVQGGGVGMGVEKKKRERGGIGEVTKR